MKKQYIKHKTFWLFSVPSICTWAWRKILGLRTLARNFSKHQVGLLEQGKISTYGMKIGFLVVFHIQNMKDHSSCSAEFYYKGRMVVWPPARSNSLVEIQSLLPEVRFHERDSLPWLASKSGRFTIT